jgi:hypothetical protein
MMAELMSLIAVISAPVVSVLLSLYYMTKTFACQIEKEKALY